MLNGVRSDTIPICPRVVPLPFILEETQVRRQENNARASKSRFVTTRKLDPWEPCDYRVQKTRMEIPDAFLTWIVDGSFRGSHYNHCHKRGRASDLKHIMVPKSPVPRCYRRQLGYEDNTWNLSPEEREPNVHESQVSAPEQGNETQRADNCQEAQEDTHHPCHQRYRLQPNPQLSLRLRDFVCQLAG
ncbi:hypothetical protein NDU88_001476 [Pleurodeles waltl]|uniref:Uncharacterized protein n=1 Tax=Pleurodeles waltl TaxID=8319 RepID=A0AAV7W058_PLEWA|nr:hypothetical protein NDU88_001476 [Pleurodeles waltl]